MDMPPTRYRVVERGRRLVVLDSWNNDAPVAQAPPALGGVREPDARRQTASPAGPDPSQLVLETRAWFDDKAPRRIRLDTANQGRASLALAGAIVLGALLLALIGWPILLITGWLLVASGPRKTVRRFVTGWLDSAGQALR